jgi:FKBP-type peptidyl-prolyl cis-trans isomerase FkpA
VWSVARELCGIVRIVYSSVRLAVILAAAVLIGACGDAQSTTNIPTAPTSTAEYSQTDVVEGSGASAAAGNIITVNYTGWLYDVLKPDKKGLQFETSIGTSPLIFQLGAGQVIPGWDQGIVGMKVGGTRRIVLPPSLGYGGIRNGIIPPYTSLVFDIQLIAVQ